MGGTDAVVPEGDGNRWCMRNHGSISTLNCPNDAVFQGQTVYETIAETASQS